jgi:CRP-like cAMP-binding protein
MSAISGLLQSIPLLGGLTEHQLSAVSSIAQRLTFAAGQELIKADAQADGAYFLIDGEVECLSQIDGEPSVTRIPSGAVLLELAMIVDINASATCVVRAPAKVLKIPRQAMHDLMQNDVSLTEAILERLTRRLADMADAMREASEPFEERDLKAG